MNQNRIRPRLSPGFTLIEMMVTVAIIAILAAIAVPNYNDYVTRSRITDATTALADGRVKMEQYFQDNRTYVSSGTTCGTGTTLPTSAGKFAVSCSGTATTYTITATGSSPMNGFVYTINQDGTRTTANTSASPWGARTNASCWIIKRNGAC